MIQIVVRALACILRDGQAEACTTNFKTDETPPAVTSQLMMI